MRPGPYFFALGIAVGIAATGTFFWYRGENIVDDRLEARTKELSDGWSETSHDLADCQARLRAAGLLK
jgi:hypothetical protein